ncbi:MAG: S8 family serine peptidase [Cyanobacteriota bacterium]
MFKLKNLTLVAVLLLFSCNIKNINSSTNYSNLENKNINNAQYKKSIFEAFQNKYKNKPKYNGDIDIKINTGLLNQNNNDKKVFSVASYNFDIKNVPQGNIIFQESYVMENNKLFELEKQFKINDTSKKYTLYIKRGDDNDKNDKVIGNININTSEILKNKDFKCNDEFIEESILLNSNNKMLIKLQGKKKSIFTIMIIEGSKSQYLRKKNLLGNHETNEKHLKSNDINIFDPNDKNSISNLDVYSGDIKNGNNITSSISVNDKDNLQFESGKILIKFKDISFLETFKTLYGAEIEEKLDDVYKMKLNLDKAPINNLDSLIKKYNELTFESINSASFSSLASLKTFAILFDFVTKYKNSVDFIELNSSFESQEPPPPVRANDLGDDPRYLPYYDYYDIANPKPKEPNRIGDNLWLRKMRILESWNYSVGSNILAAHIDNSFKNPDPITNPEIPPTRIFLNGMNNMLDFGISDYCYPSNYHGQACIQIAYGEKDNYLSSVGISPNTKVMPISYLPPNSNSSDSGRQFNMAKGFDIAIKSKVDLISFASNANMFGWGIFLNTDVSDDYIYGILGSNTMIGKIIEASKNNIPVILAAGNNSSNTNFYSPAILSERSPNDGIIVVGGVKEITDVKSNRFGLLESFYLDDTHINGSGSNYGTNVVWAYWDNVYTARYRPDSQREIEPKTNLRTGACTVNNSSVIPKGFTKVGNDFSIAQSFGGTSSSSPQVAGIVALMKSRNKDLKNYEIETIIRDTSKENVSKHILMQSDVKLVDALGAVEQAIKMRKNEPKDPDSFLPGDGYVYTGNNFYNEENAQEAYFLDEKIKAKIFYTNYLSREKRLAITNKVLRIRAWDKGFITNNVINNELEILSFEEVNLFPRMTNLICKACVSDPLKLRENALITIKGSDLLPPVNTLGKIIFKNTLSGTDFILNLNESTSPYISPVGTEISFYLETDKAKSSDGKTLSNDILSSSGLSSYFLLFEGFDKSAVIPDINNPNAYTIQKDSKLSTTSSSVENVNIVRNLPNSPADLIPGGKVAIPTNDTLKQKMEKGLVRVLIGGVKLNLLEIIQNYAIYGIPDNILNDPELIGTIKNGLLDVIITNGIPNSINPNGDPLIVLKEALKIVAVTIGLNPTYPDGYPPENKYPWIELNKAIPVRKGEIHNIPLLNLDSTPTVSGKNVNFILKSYDSSKITVEIPQNAQYGIQDINISAANGLNYLIKDAINVIDEKTTVVNNVSTVKDSNGNNVPVVGVNTQMPVVPEDRVAISVTQLLSKDLSNTVMYIAGRRLTFLELVQNYAIYGIPSDILTNNDAQNNIKGTLQDLIIKNNLGETVQSFKDALKIVAQAIGLNPKYPDGTAPINQVPFLENNPANDGNKRKGIRRGNKFAVTIRGLKDNKPVQAGTNISGRLTITERNGEYVVIQVPYDATLGVQNVWVHESNSASGEDVTFNNGIDVLRRDDIVSDTGRDGNQEIYIMKPDGSNQTRVTNHQSTYNYAPDWNPNKTQIQYRELNSNDYIDICVINPDGSGYQNLTNTPNIDEYSVSYSSDSTKFSYTSMQTGNEDIWTMNTDGSNKTNLTASSTSDDYRANWSPDGTKIAFVSDRDGTPEIYVMNADGSNQTRITSGAYDNDEPKWTRDGKKILYVTETKADGTDQLWLMNPDGTGKEQLTFEDDFEPHFSPDGTKVAYQRWINSNNIESRVADIVSRNITNLTNNGSRNLTSGWLVDGSKILFTSRITGGNEIYTIKPDGTDLFRLTYNNFSDYNSDGSAPSYPFGIQSIKMDKNKKIAKKIKHRDPRLSKPKRKK